MNASISVVCYKSKKLSNGQHPLMLQISRYGKRKFCPTTKDLSLDSIMIPILFSNHCSVRVIEKLNVNRYYSLKPLCFFSFTVGVSRSDGSSISLIGFSIKSSLRIVLLLMIIVVYIITVEITIRIFYNNTCIPFKFVIYLVDYNISS